MHHTGSRPPASSFFPLSRTTGSRCAAAQFCGAGRAYAGRSGGGWGGAGRNALGPGHGGQTRLPDALPRRRTTGPGAVSALACRRDSFRASGMGSGKSAAYGANVSQWAGQKLIYGVDIFNQPYDTEADWSAAYRIAERLAGAGLGITVHVAEVAPVNVAAVLRMPGITRLGRYPAGYHPHLLDMVARSGVTVECALTCNVVLGPPAPTQTIRCGVSWQQGFPLRCVRMTRYRCAPPLVVSMRLHTLPGFCHR